MATARRLPAGVSGAVTMRAAMTGAIATIAEVGTVTTATEADVATEVTVEAARLACRVDLHLGLHFMGWTIPRRKTLQKGAL